MLFETVCGDGELVSAKDLKELMQVSEYEFELVFVAACDSKFIG